MVTTKGWDDFQGHWRMRKKPGIVQGPDPEMSLTSGGHVVEIEKGKFVRTDDMVQAEDPPFSRMFWRSKREPNQPVSWMDLSSRLEDFLKRQLFPLYRWWNYKIGFTEGKPGQMKNSVVLRSGPMKVVLWQ